MLHNDNSNTHTDLRVIFKAQFSIFIHCFQFYCLFFTTKCTKKVLKYKRLQREKSHKLSFLNHFCSAAAKYCPLLIKEGGISLLEKVLELESSHPETKDMAR